MKKKTFIIVSIIIVISGIFFTNDYIRIKNEKAPIFFGRILQNKGEDRTITESMSNLTSSVFINDLKQLGHTFVETPMDKIDTFLQPQAVTVLTNFDGKGELGNIRIYSYNSNSQMEKAAAGLDKGGCSFTYQNSDGAMTGMDIEWVSYPHFFKQGSIIVQYIGKDEKIIQMLNMILGNQFAGYSDY